MTLQYYDSYDIPDLPAAYKPPGNINTLAHTGITSGVVDQLTYSYNGHRLTNVSDAVAGADPILPYHYGGSTAYTYDANGNMKTRINTVNTGNNITAISYNHLNLPSSVTATGGNVTYTYDANGRKLRSTNGIQGQTRDYIDGIEYVAGTIELIHHGEGRILNTGGSYVFEYYLKDHLDNNRSGFGAGTNVTVPTFSADYYPFGMQYQQYVRAGSPKNNYLYNGKELQDGLKLYDYGARLYDPAIGRWGTMDPLAENHHGYPYNYVLNNPMSYIDPFGLDTVDVNSSQPIQEGDAVFYEEGVALNSLKDVTITAKSLRVSISLKVQIAYLIVG